MSAAKIIYFPVNLVVSIAGGVLAGAVFNQVWKRLGDNDVEPKPADLDQPARQVFLAAAAHGLVYGLVKAAVSRGTAKGFRKAVGTDPVQQ
ncbi:DUF4235 domain-containing protein [Rhodococcus antarcticus]|uniref:DUF4235 domain-containing protein n=1 Tax=Rhodococcus antarcticus TaxID=2987751 RepID=A0ABY6P3M5_9NOCA|nr:DUF4235 domain-containing protein [Rhodococcus antarcticus]UZJ26252.1 DUF4235 domain-containing protein [Rhodococcus antarcticus]